MSVSYLDKAGLTRLWNKIKGKFAPLSSPALTGTPTAPTAARDTKSTQIATTAFVEEGISFKQEGSISLSSASSTIDVSLTKNNSYKTYILGNSVTSLTVNIATHDDVYCKSNIYILIVNLGPNNVPVAFNFESWTELMMPDDAITLGHNEGIEIGAVLTSDPMLVVTKSEVLKYNFIS